ncbi:MAG TPA: aspartyl/asparaginyl beta-hydroxylase domain-containing protein [Kofleriaceae bacterium]|nr:aspartyl/asparaginyl beta-hydroxylase domain-containing protein [Kofleriaceae bacterium]
MSTILSTLRDRFGNELSTRVESMAALCATNERPVLPARRGVANLYLPELATCAWHDPAQFSWVADVEAATDDIVAEYAAQDLAYYLPDSDRTSTPVVAADGLTNPAFGWKGVMLRRGGIWNRELARRYPATISALHGVPLAAGDVMLSVLAPGSKIVPHTGLTNLDLTCHLGLDIPPDCGIEVGDETRTWDRGKVLVFDDTYRHWAWNRSERPRLVLLFDIWHPGLEPAEIAQLKAVLPLLYRS